MPSSKGEPACHQDHSALVQMAGSKRRKLCIVEHTCSCRHWRALGSHQATSGCAELVPDKRCTQKDPCCTVQGLSGAYLFLLCREYSSVNVESQQMEARGHGADGRKKVDRDQG